MANGQSDCNQKWSEWIGLTCLPIDWWLAGKKKSKTIVERPVDKIVLSLESDAIDPSDVL